MNTLLFIYALRTLISQSKLCEVELHFFQIRDRTPMCNESIPFMRMKINIKAIYKPDITL